MRRLCMILGLALLLGAAALSLYNERQSAAAGERAVGVLEQMVERIPAQVGADDDSLPVEEIDGYGYIGYLSIPALELELPVMDQWDYERLETAPCRYGGSVADGTFVIIGHNYRRHFGPIRRLKPGDEVCFTDMAGRRVSYRVARVREISAYAAVAEEGYALTLLTCTYGGEGRTAVFCEELESFSVGSCKKNVQKW